MEQQGCGQYPSSHRAHRRASTWLWTLAAVALLSSAPAGAQFVDSFDRPDNAALGNGWIEKSPAAFALINNGAAKQAVTSGYRDNIVYRPAAENLADVEVSLEFRLVSLPAGYPQIFARVQTDTINTGDWLDGYMLYISDSTGTAILGRQTSYDFVNALATLNFGAALNTTDTFRLRMTVEGTAPVQLAGYLERLNGATWEVVAQANANDASGQSLTTAGSVGFGGYIESSYIFDNFRRTDLGVGGGDNPTPAISGLNPTEIDSAGGNFTLVVNGAGFVPSSVVRWDGADRTTTYVSDSQLEAAILAGDIASPGTAQVTVFSPAPGGGLSNAQPFTINDGSGNSNPVPALTALSPEGAVAGGGALTVTVSGTGFTADSVVRFNGQDRATTYISSVEVRADLTAADVDGTNEVSTVTVATPGPGGGTSAPLDFFVLEAGADFFFDGFNRPDSPDVGNGWVEKEESEFFIQNGEVVSTSTEWEFHDAITTRPLAEDTSDSEISIEFVRTAGSPHYPQLHSRVQRDTLGFFSTLESYIFFVYDNPLDPPQVGMFAVQPPIQGRGECYIDDVPLSEPLVEDERYRLRFRTEGINPVNLTGSVERWNGQDWVVIGSGSATHDDNTPVDPNLFCDPGTMPAPILTPGTFGFAKYYNLPDRYDNFYWFDVEATPNPAPTVGGLNPSNATAGTAGLVLDVNGTGFVPGSVVRWNGSDRVTTFVSGTELEAQILTADLASEGTATVTVFNPAPGGGVSNGATFVIDAPPVGNPVPAVASLSPNSTVEGAAGFDLTVNGSNFVAGSVVRWAGADRATTFVSANELEAAIPASDVATAGAFEVTVFNPLPGGGVSNGQTFVVQATGGSGFFDDFGRADGGAIGNGWIEKAPAVFNLAGGVVTKQSTGSAYWDNIVYRPAAEDLLNVETSVEMRFTAGQPGYPQLFARVQSDTAGILGILDGYILYIDDRTDLAVLGRQLGGNFLTVLTTLNLNPVLNTTDTYRMRMSVEGTNPVQINAWVERRDGAVWTAVGQATYLDSAANRITGAGSVGFSGDYSQNYVYDNFARTDLGSAGGNPIPVVNALAPGSVAEGGPSFTLTVTGAGFVNGSVVRWGGADRPTNFVSSTELEATIGAADVAAAGAVGVSVFNPSPGGGVSNSMIFSVTTVGGNSFSDDFGRADGNAIGNGWLEKSPAAFTLTGGVVAKQIVGTAYWDNVVYRPAAEDQLDVETSVDFRLLNGQPGYPQLFARLQSSTVTLPGVLDGYILFIDDNPSQAVLGRQLGSDFLTVLAVIPVAPQLNATDTYRMRMRVQGTSPVQVSAFVERFDGGGWTVIGQATVNDNAANRIDTAGSVGFGGDYSQNYVYDNFQRSDP